MGWKFLENLEIDLLYNLAAPLPYMSSKEMKSSEDYLHGCAVCSVIHTVHDTEMT